MTTSNEAQQEALDGLLDAWDDYTAFDIGPHLTCGETDALAAVFTVLEAHDLAESLLDGHASSDDEGDSHFNYRRNA